MALYADQKLSELIRLAKSGDNEALTVIVTRLGPLLRKYARLVGHDEAYSDLVCWIVDAIRRYQPKDRGETSESPCEDTLADEEKEPNRGRGL